MNNVKREEERWEIISHIAEGSSTPDGSNPDAVSRFLKMLCEEVVVLRAEVTKLSGQTRLAGEAEVTSPVTS